MSFLTGAALLGGSLIGDFLQADAAGDAADTAARASKDANALQKYMYDTTRSDNEPWRQAGQDSLNKLMGLLNDGSLTSRFAGTNVQNEPGYAFGMKEGMKAIDNSASARGGIGGAALKAGTRYAQDYAGTKYGQAFDRWRMENSDIFNRLSGVAGTGQQINAANSAAGQNYANTAGGNMMDMAALQGAAAMRSANIYGNALNQGIAQYGRMQPPSYSGGSNPLTPGYYVDPTPPGYYPWEG
jgi:hypothetical protein